MDAALLAQPGPLAGARDHRPAAPHLQPPGRLVAQPVRADRARLLLRRHASSSWRWPATAATTLALPDDAGSARRRSTWARPTSASTRWSPARAGCSAASTTRRRRWMRCAPRSGQPLDADAAFALGLVTSNPDDIDWADETRIAIEERVAMSPDALTGMEANLRFNGPENMFTRVFGRLTAWQNWIFQRPNAVGEKGALKVYGKGEQAPSSTGTASDPRKRHEHHQLQREDPQQRQPGRGPHAAARARAVAAQLPQLVGRHGPGGQPELRRLPAHRGQRRSRRAGRSSAT